MLLAAGLAGVGYIPPARAQVPQDPDISAQRLLVRGMTRAFLGDDEGALALFDQILKLRPDDPTANAAIAATLVRLDDLPRAMFYAERAVALAPDRPENLRLAAELRETSGDAIGSLEAYDALIGLLPTDLGARVAKARLLNSLEQRQAARDTYAEALSLGVRPAEVLQEYLDVLIALGELEPALETARALQAVRRDIGAFRTIGQILVRLARDEEAADVFAKGLEEWPGDPELLAALDAVDPGRAAGFGTRSGTPTEIAEELTHNAEDDVRNMAIRIEAVSANLGLRRIQTAVGLVEDGLLFFPGNQPLLFLAVDTYLHALDPDRALEILSGAEELAPGDEEWSRSIAAARAAAEWIRTSTPTVIELPADPRARSWSVLAGADAEVSDAPEITSASLARALRSARQEGSAAGAAILTGLTARQGASALEWLYLGDLLADSGKRSEAAAAWQHALEKAPLNPIVLSRLQ
jgi:tetratricopeptide (TPR) repeat protein